ncbi:MAG TPA: hypothetical protein PLT87_00045 [Spirochaetales bacterium]|nr:hypothetical protein [Spirochaetales bacterium]
MQAIMESIFDVAYLITVLTIGILMARNSKGKKQYLLFGIMAIVLGAGDAFHLVPRVIALSTGRMQDYTAALGIGKAITSITMTIFYVMLYHVWRIRYNLKGKTGLSVAVYALAAIRIGLCLLPQNQWTSASAPLAWGIYRNIPFVILGALIIALLYKAAKHNKDESFRFMWLTIVLSFAFYIPVVLWADAMPVIGVLMIPKTLAYVWAILIGYNDMKRYENNVQYTDDFAFAC